jgi:hypothetical protein
MRKTDGRWIKLYIYIFKLEEINKGSNQNSDTNR